MNFTENEIKVLKRTIHNANLWELAGMNTWKKAFEFYNTNNERALGMKCRSCYAKVLHFIIKKQNENVLQGSKETN